MLLLYPQMQEGVLSRNLGVPLLIIVAKADVRHLLLLLPLCRY